MELEGKIWKDGKFWIVEVPSLNISTQGKSRKNALLMIKDAVYELIKSYYDKISDKFEISIHDYKREAFGLTSNDNKLLLSFLLIRQREESGLTIREAAGRINSKNPNAYAQYEHGKIDFSINQYERLIKAVNPRRSCILRVT
jgi:predicted RNase H-like HicB family nuclease